MAKVKFNKNFNVNRVVKRLVYTILSLYVGGTILSTFGSVMNCTYSPFYSGLSLIGWTVTSSVTGNTSAGCSNTTGWTSGAVYRDVITSVSGSGILTVVGIIAVASIVLEFVSWH